MNFHSLPACAAVSLLGLTLACLPDAASAAQNTAAGQVLTPAGTHSSVRAPSRNFTGSVRVDRIFKANDAAPYTAAYVTFEPGARTNWHSHVAGQHLIVVFGKGLTGTEDGRVMEIRPGDEIWCPPNVRHWHGAAPDTGMTHIAVTGIAGGKSTDWFEPVTDEQYGAR
ncbi:MAG: cupin domain-containing protein [Desulfovibrionaceae bacterium]|nr:cupin domain-containing protein [Desulfovibrionaceae bacterium]